MDRENPTSDDPIDDGASTTANSDGPVPGWPLPAASRNGMNRVLGIGALIALIAMVISGVAGCVYTWVTM